jgi:hypothetical protein
MGIGVMSEQMDDPITGQAPPGEPVGAIVQTNSGDYEITGVNSDGSYTSVPIVQVQSYGQAPSGLTVGAIVVTAGGDYEITGVNSDGSYNYMRNNGRINHSG